MKDKVGAVHVGRDTKWKMECGEEKRQGFVGAGLDVIQTAREARLDARCSGIPFKQRRPKSLKSLAFELNFAWKEKVTCRAFMYHVNALDINSSVQAEDGPHHGYCIHLSGTDVGKPCICIKLLLML